MTRRTLTIIAAACLALAGVALGAWGVQGRLDPAGAAATATAAQLVFALGVLAGVGFAVAAAASAIKARIAEQASEVQAEPPAPATELPPPSSLRLAADSDALAEQARDALAAGRPEDAVAPADAAVALRRELVALNAELFAADLDAAVALRARIEDALPRPDASAD